MLYCVYLGFLSGPTAGFSRETFLAFYHSGTSYSVVVAECLVRGTSFISDVVFVDPLVSFSWVTAATTAAVVIAGNQNLRRYVDIGPLCFSEDFDPIAHGRSRSECPARSAVNGDVLVSLDGQVVGTVDVAPPKGSGDLGGRYFGQRFEYSRFEVGSRDEVGQSKGEEKADDRSFNHFLIIS